MIYLYDVPNPLKQNPGLKFSNYVTYADQVGCTTPTISSIDHQKGKHDPSFQ